MNVEVLRSKAGLTAVVLLVCALFFALSKWKRRQGQAQDPEKQSVELNTAAGPRGAEDVALLKRAQETARGRAETARTDRQAGRQVAAARDDQGNPYERRATPDPIPEYMRTLAPPAEQAAEVHLAPALRIRGRQPSTQASNGATEGVDYPPAASAVSRVHRTQVEPTGMLVPSSEEKRRPERFVPFGRLIKAELVITLESTQDEMPLIGLIVEPVYNNGLLVIPAGTEVHSMARPDRVRDRIVSVTTWRLVFPREGMRPNGRQITFDGIALDRDDKDGNGFTWGITDGSFGLRGRAVRNAQRAEELMLFAAEALKAAGASLMDRQPTALGVQVEANAKNAALAGGQAVLTNFADRIAKELERNGVYIQVPAGKQFYIYPRQVIDPDRADLPSNIAGVE
jgi:hypothetical protein